MSGSKQYGLILPKKLNKPLVNKPSIFNDSDDESSSALEAALKKQSLKNQSKKQTQIEIQKAVSEDPTVYEYDKIYDDIQKHKEIKKTKEKDVGDRKPKYITALLKSAELRKKENERRVERKVQKEREAEGETYKDKGAFVTSSYRKKMQEMEEEEERERRESQLEEMMDVTKQKDLSGFYRHFLKQKVGEEQVPVIGERTLRSSVPDKKYDSDKKPPQIKSEPSDGETKRQAEKQGTDLNSIKCKMETSAAKYEDHHKISSFDSSTESLKGSSQKHKESSHVPDSKHSKTIERDTKYVTSNQDADSDFSSESDSSEGKYIERENKHTNTYNNDTKTQRTRSQRSGRASSSSDKEFSNKRNSHQSQKTEHYSSESDSDNSKRRKSHSRENSNSHNSWHSHKTKHYSSESDNDHSKKHKSSHSTEKYVKCSKRDVIKAYGDKSKTLDNAKPQKHKHKSSDTENSKKPNSHSEKAKEHSSENGSGGAKKRKSPDEEISNKNMAYSKFAKRNVGKAFEDAKQRYLERKALREAALKN